METAIGVFLCNCGGGLKNIDFCAAAKRVADIPCVTHVSLISTLCSEEGKEEMLSCIREKDIDRVVIGACSPEFKHHIFRRVLEEAEMNGHLLSMANIREQCSWAHDGDVTGKAVELIRMAVNRARLLEAVEKQELPVNKDVLVVGGGFSAMGSALQLSRVGLRATLLLEEEAASGVRIREQEALWGLDTSSMISAVEEDENIEVITSARITATEGEIGDFAVTITAEGQTISRKYGAIVIATGYQTEPALASGAKLRAETEAISDVNIVSQAQLCQMLRDPTLESRPTTIGFLFDFCEEHSRFPTVATLNNALAVKEKWKSDIYVFCRNVKVDGEGMERLYREARDRGVVFLKLEAPPRITAENGRVEIEARDILLGQDVMLACDLLVGEDLILPAKGTDNLSSLLHIRRDSRGFYQDENVHLYPVAAEKKGIFFVGGCRGDSDPGRDLTDISSSVIGVYTLLSSGRIVIEKNKVWADPQKCVACLTCIRVCPHGAIQLVREDSKKQVALVSDLACDMCGICAALCPAKAMKFQGYRDDQVLAQIEAIGES